MNFQIFFWHSMQYTLPPNFDLLDQQNLATLWATTEPQAIQASLDGLVGSSGTGKHSDSTGVTAVEAGVAAKSFWQAMQ